jgi:hypothetical protein
MDAAVHHATEPSTAGPRLGGAAALLALLAWQAWLTLGLFGAEAPWIQLTNDQPVLSGAHPQHQHLGLIGAQAFELTGRTCAYDPAFQAGYLKTPIFNGSRLAEVCFLLADGDYRPAAYKLGLAGLCLVVPVLLWLAARGFGLDRLAAFLATGLGLLIWWGPHSRGALEAGESDLFLASLALLAHVGLLCRFDRTPGALVWLGVVLTGALGWFAQPLLLPIALPLLLSYYLCTGVRHGLAWHVALLLGQLAALAVNLPWLIDWAAYWWLRLPLPSATEILRHRTLGTLWDAPIWCGPTERLLALMVFSSAILGIGILHTTRRRPEARLLALGAGGMWALALLGISWEPLGHLGTAALIAPALWFAAIPAAFAPVWLASKLLERAPVGKIALAGLLTAGAGALWLQRDLLAPIYHRGVAAEPLRIGLGREHREVVSQLKRVTTTAARILWEDRRLPRTTPRWSALLPLLTERHYLGGLDSDGFIEHSAISFLNQQLDGRPIAVWSDQQLADYCARYNIGWVAAWTPATIKRFSEWDGVADSVPLVDDVAGYLFTLKRPQPSYALKGQATLIHADARHITLGDVVPDGDVVVLSLHWQAGITADPGRVVVEREASGHDPIGFIRLRTQAPVARVTLTWGARP